MNFSTTPTMVAFATRFTTPLLPRHTHILTAQIFSQEYAWCVRVNGNLIGWQESAKCGRKVKRRGANIVKEQSVPMKTHGGVCGADGNCLKSHLTPWQDSWLPHPCLLWRIRRHSWHSHSRLVPHNIPCHCSCGVCCKAALSTHCVKNKIEI